MLSPVMVGVPPLGVTVKFVAEVAVPPGVVTAMSPVLVVGTVAVIWVAPLTANTALTPLKVTADAAVKLVPVIITDEPTGRWWA